MKKVSVKFLNCYGIKKLEHEFDFKKHSSYMIYASNGTMKTSFTKTFADLSAGKKPKDEIFGKNTTAEVIVDDNLVSSDEIFVVKSYEDEYISPNSAKLMVHRELKQKFDDATKNVKLAEESLWTVLSGQFADNIDFQAELSKLLLCSPLDVIKSLQESVDSGMLEEDEYDINWQNTSYCSLFSDAVETYIAEPKNLIKICEYAERYNELIENSPVFKRGVFSHNNADTVFESLDTNGFFGADHSLVLNGIDETIKTAEDLSMAIKKEKEKIFADEKLQKKFDTINKGLKKKTLAPFRDTIEANPQIISELGNYLVFKRKVWVSILKKVKTELLNVLKEYSKCQSIVEEIKQKAVEERSQWDEVLAIFKARFTVPFTIEVPNKNDVSLLGDMPEFKFKYVDPETNEETEVARKKLETVLSQGEKRALFLLNIINDLEALKMSGKEVLVVTDDIAESFDYKNKYAIIEYLQEMMDSSNLHFIVLTHNFDFYRTVATRARDKVFPQMVQRIQNGLEIVEPKYVHKNPFSLIRKGVKNNNDSDIITSIPFVRNIIEYTNGDTNTPNYLALTAMLHLKPNTKDITFKNLEDIYKEELRGDTEYTFAKDREDSKVYYLILNLARDISFRDREDINLEDKIILSMATRLLAEEYMINTLLSNGCEQSTIDNISNSQTGKLVGLFKEYCSDKNNEIKELNSVLLMSSENIHINSFMFEPLIDTSNKQLSDCFKSMCALQPPRYEE